MSEINSGKLDRILAILEGDGPSRPGLMAQVKEHETILKGDNGSFGLMQRVSVMWRAHVWILCTLSGLLGFMLKTLFKW